MHRMVTTIPGEGDGRPYYRGKLCAGGCLVWTPRGDQLGSFTCLRNHSPSGFGWGYAGSGPAQLALALLADALLSADAPDALDEARRFYQRFKFEVIATIPGRLRSWSIHRNLILEWVAEQVGLDLGALAEESIDSAEQKE